MSTRERLVFALASECVSEAMRFIYHMTIGFKVRQMQ